MMDNVGDGRGDIVGTVRQVFNVEEVTPLRHTQICEAHFLLDI